MQRILRMLAFGNVTGHSKELLGATGRTAHDSTFHRNPAFSTGTLLIGARRETVLGSATATAGMPQFPKGGIEPEKIIGMNLRPHLCEGLWLPFLPMPVNASITRVVFEATRV